MLKREINSPKHVIEHRPAKRFEDMTPVEFAKWVTSGSADTSDSDSSDSDSDDDHVKIRLPYRTTIYGRAGQGMTNLMPRLLEKIKLEQQSDASPLESAPKPEQSCAAVAKQACFAAEQAAEAKAAPPPECIVPPRAPRRRRARPAQ